MPRYWLPEPGKTKATDSRSESRARRSHGCGRRRSDAPGYPAARTPPSAAAPKPSLRSRLAGPKHEPASQSLDVGAGIWVAAQERSFVPEPSAAPRASASSVKRASWRAPGGWRRSSKVRPEFFFRSSESCSTTWTQPPSRPVTKN